MLDDVSLNNNSGMIDVEAIGTPLANVSTAQVEVKTTEVASTPKYFPVTAKGVVRQFNPVPTNVTVLEACETVD